MKDFREEFLNNVIKGMVFSIEYTDCTQVFEVGNDLQYPIVNYKVLENGIETHNENDIDLEQWDYKKLDEANLKGLTNIKVNQTYEEYEYQYKQNLKRKLA